MLKPKFSLVPPPVVLNMLDAEGNRGSLALTYAADKLHKAGRKFGPLTAPEKAVCLELGTFKFLVKDLERRIEFDGGFVGKSKGPISQACQAAERFVELAIAAGYRILIPELRALLAEYVRSAFTDGYGDYKPPTTMGETQLAFGCFDYSKFKKH